jgi:hypothetical protein
MARSGDTKLLCHVAQMIIALSRVSLWPLSGGKSLVLYQEEDPASMKLSEAVRNLMSNKSISQKSLKARQGAAYPVSPLNLSH